VPASVPVPVPAGVGAGAYEPTDRDVTPLDP